MNDKLWRRACQAGNGHTYMYCSGNVALSIEGPPSSLKMSSRVSKKNTKNQFEALEVPATNKSQGLVNPIV